MSLSRAVLLLLIFILTLPGCAHTHFGVAKKETTNGIRYYRPATYILITPDYEKGKASVNLWHGPDTSKSYVINPWSIASTNDTQIEFNRGMLSKVTNNADSTKIAQHAIASGAEVLKKALDTATSAAKVSAAASLDRNAVSGPDTIYLFKVTDTKIVQLYPSVPEEQPVQNPIPVSRDDYQRAHN